MPFMSAPQALLALLTALHLPAMAQVQALFPTAPPAQQALTTLISSLGPGESIVMGAGAAAPRQSALVGRGETLDALIRRTLGDQPFKETYLRSVYVEVNPQAFPNGTAVQRLAPGTALLVPNADDLRRPLLAGMGVSVGARTASSGSAGPAPAHASAGAEKRQWVRFP